MATKYGQLRDYIAATKGRTSPPSPQGWSVIGLCEISMQRGDVEIIYQNENGNEVYGNGSTINSAALAAIATIKEGER